MSKTQTLKKNPNYIAITCNCAFWPWLFGLAYITAVPTSAKRWANSWKLTIIIITCRYLDTSHAHNMTFAVMWHTNAVTCLHVAFTQISKQCGLRGQEIFMRNLMSILWIVDSALEHQSQSIINLEQYKLIFYILNRGDIYTCLCNVVVACGLDSLNISCMYDQGC